MSINITVHGNTLSRNMLGDYERCRREELKRRKLLRLAQVRQQSKDIAAQIRNRVSEERKKQVDRIDQIKEDEVRAWKKRHLGLTEDQLDECLATVGEAHQAARKENELEKKRLEQQKKNRLIANKRGREALAKLEEEKRKKIKFVKKPTTIGKRSVDIKTLEDVATQVGDSLTGVEKSLNAQDANVNESIESLTHAMVVNNDPIVTVNVSGNNLHRPNINNFIENNSDSMSSTLETEAKKLAAAKPQKSIEYFQTFDRQTLDNQPLNAHDIHEGAPNGKDHFTQIREIVSRRRNTNSNINIQTNASVLSGSSFPLASIPINSGNINRISSNTNPHMISEKANSPSKRPRNQLATNIEGKSLAKSTYTLSHQTDAPIITEYSKTQPRVDGKSVTQSSYNQPNLSHQPNVPRSTRPVRNQSRVDGQSNKKFSSNTQPSYVPRFTEAPKTQLRIDGQSMPIAVPKDTNIESTDPISHKVQYYDHANRYSKEYTPQDDLVVHSNTLDISQPNAMEAAHFERRLDAERARVQEELRRQTESRSQLALERERVRKDYDLMNAQLEQLSKQKEYNKAFTHPNYDFAEERLKQMAIERQKTMNLLVEDMLPSQVPITCPRVSKSNSADSSGLNVADAENLVRVVDLRSQFGEIINSSQSESDKTNQRNAFKNTNDVPNKPSGNTDNIHTTDEFKKTPSADKRTEIHKQNKENIENQRITWLELQEIEKRENEVRAKERKLEKRLKQLYLEEQKRAAQVVSTEIPSGPGNVKNIHIDKDAPEGPVQIIIQVHGGTTKASRNTLPRSAIRKPKTVPLNEDAKHVFPKTPAKTTHAPDNMINGEVIDGSTSSTVYNSLPSEIQTPLTNLVQTETIQGKPSDQKRLASDALQQYIRRLLGMSRASIDQLELSNASTVPTPTSSIINVSTNVSNVEIIDEQHIDKITNFINDNHSFIAELEKSLKEVTLSDNEASNVKAVENAWMHTLNKKEMEMKKKQEKLRRKVKADKTEEQHQNKIIPIRPILKNKLSSPKKVQVVVDERHQHLDRVQSDNLEESTKVFSRRIAELNEQILKVRKEKKRILENTYSSIGSTISDRAQNSSEYLDIAPKITSDHSNNTSKTMSEPISLPDDRVTEAIASKLSQSKQIGVSRDSGLGGISRPVTASDVGAESPEVRQEQKYENYEFPNAQVKSHPNIKETEHTIARKPPSSLTRFGHQIEQPEKGHELSTITECDTPIATSRLNSSITDGGVSKQIPINSTPTIPLTVILDHSPKTASKLRIAPFQSPPKDDISDITNQDLTTKLKISPFPSHRSYAEGLSEMLDSASVLNFDNESVTTEQPKELTPIRPFPSHKEFAKNTPGLCTSASILAANETPDTFPDIEAELRKRNLLQFSDDEHVVAKPQQPSPPKPTISTQIRPQSTSSSDNLEQEMQKLGLNWASSMIKKNKVASHAMTSSSSSNDDGHQANILKPSKTSAQLPQAVDVFTKTDKKDASIHKPADDESNGKPLNLKEFLARELMKRSNSLSSSSVHDDSTLASHFLRSLLGSSSSETSGHRPVSQNQRHLTSTPVREMRPATPGPPHRPAAKDSSSQKSPTQNLFSGESELSSVRGSSLTSSGKESSQSLTKPDGAKTNQPRR